MGVREDAMFVAIVACTAEDVDSIGDADGPRGWVVRTVDTVEDADAVGNVGIAARGRDAWIVWDELLPDATSRLRDEVRPRGRALRGAGRTTSPTG